MVAADVITVRRGGLVRSGVWRCWLTVYAAIWILTLLSAILIAVCGPGVQAPVRTLLGLRLSAADTPRPTVAHVWVLAAHNIPVCCWPLLLGVIGAHQSRLGRRAADLLVAASVAVNVLQVGLALGAYGLSLVAFVPQLPFEWAALALGATGWRLQQTDPLTVRQAVMLLVVAVMLLLIAGVLETFAVPHRCA